MIAETIYIMPPSAGAAAAAASLGRQQRSRKNLHLIAVMLVQIKQIITIIIEADLFSNGIFRTYQIKVQSSFPYYTQTHMYTAVAAAGPAAVAGGARNPHRFKRSRNSCSAQPTDRPAARPVGIVRQQRHDECLREKFNDNRDARRSL